MTWAETWRPPPATGGHTDTGGMIMWNCRFADGTPIGPQGPEHSWSWRSFMERAPISCSGCGLALADALHSRPRWTACQMKSDRGRRS